MEFKFSESQGGYSNILIIKMINDKLSEDIPFVKKKLYISDAIKQVTNNLILEQIIQLLIKINLIDIQSDIVINFKNELSQLNYSKNDNTRLSALFYSLLLDYEVRTEYYVNLTNNSHQKLNIKVRRKQLIHNYNKILDHIKKQSVIYQKGMIEKYPAVQREKTYKEIIKSISLFSYENDTEIFKKEKEFFKDLKENITYNLNEKQTKSLVIKNTDTIWFNVGILFATGKIATLLNKFNDSPKKVAEHLNNSSFEKYILATKNNYRKTNTDKNIYFSRKKMNEIIKYCKENNIDITTDFINRLPLD